MSDNDILPEDLEGRRLRDIVHEVLARTNCGRTLDPDEVVPGANRNQVMAMAIAQITSTHLQLPSEVGAELGDVVYEALESADVPASSERDVPERDARSTLALATAITRRITEHLEQGLQ